MTTNPEIKKLIKDIQDGNRRSVSRLMTMFENSLDYSYVNAFEGPNEDAFIVGVTGAAGVGKSSLINHLIERFRMDQIPVGVIMVDPSNQAKGGAFLGDRIRLRDHYTDPGVFIRSVASRNLHGGLSKAIFGMVRIMEAAGFKTILIETLGIGQGEIDLSYVADTCILVTTPQLGDDIQAMKCGIMEIADIIALNKRDTDGVEKCQANLYSALRLIPPESGKNTPDVIMTQSHSERSPEDIYGIDTLYEAIIKRRSTSYVDKAKRLKKELEYILFDRLAHSIDKVLVKTKARQAEIYDGNHFDMLDALCNEVIKVLCGDSSTSC